ncbi:MAG: hypothetical protein QOJ99_5465 [Bryobacterales bacterium]|jgi:hypothetical protein|nr:hypothetical protein [Bryobacterales bacterium]
MAAVKATSLSGGGASQDLYSNQLAAIRTTPWWRYGDRDQRLLGLKVRMAREWCVYAADSEALLSDLADDSLGVLSLTRRRELLNSIAARDWDGVWRTITLTDLLFLADRYLDRYPRSPWNSPVDTALRRAGQLSDGISLRLLGSLPGSPSVQLN